ncbi:hypothetical protein C1X73_39200, partial [Pseudomonas sp. FW305-130]
LELSVVDLLSPIPAETVLVIELIVMPPTPANWPDDPPMPRLTDWIFEESIALTLTRPLAVAPAMFTLAM